MNKKKKKKKWETGFFTLNRQFSLVVIAAIIFSFVAVMLLLTVAGPYLERLNRYFDKPLQDITVIGKEVYQISEDPDWTIPEGDSIPELEEIISLYPQFDFKYEIYRGIDRETFELQGMLLSSDLTMEGYDSIVLEASNGMVIAGVIIPKLARLAVIFNLVIILLYILFLLLIIGAFAHSKVRYLKKITKNLEYIAGGDLSAKIPLKGKDEIYLVAKHINEMTSALSNEMEKEKEIEETKKQLITNISHDLRTPLTAIVGFLGVLETMDPQSNPEAVMQYIHRTYEKSKGLSHLVDQLFDYVTLSNRQITFHWEEVEPSVYFLQAFTELEHLLEPRKLEMCYSLQTSEYSVKIDCNHFQRVIENFVQNICKYAKDNSVILVEGHRMEQHYVLTVSNEANNIPEDCDDFMSRYFTTDRISGKSAGLGLAICKEIIEQQNGYLEVKVNVPIFETIITLPYVRGDIA